MTTVQVRPQRGAEFITFSGSMEMEVCISCGMLFGVPVEWLRFRKKKGDTFFCPNGHNMYYPQKPSEEERLRRALEDEKARAQREKDGLLDQLTKTEKERRRIIARAEAGVCIHCNRTFQNLVRHLETQHEGGGHGSLVALGTLTAVHKLRFYKWNKPEDGSRIVYCRATRIHYSKTSNRWKDVTCEACRKAGGLVVNAEAAR